MEKCFIINENGNLEIPRDLDPEVNKEIMEIVQDAVATGDLPKLSTFLEGGEESICLFGNNPSKKVNWA